MVKEIEEKTRTINSTMKTKGLEFLGRDYGNHNRKVR